MFNRVFEKKKRGQPARAMVKAAPDSLYVNSELRDDAIKALALSQDALDFINDASTFQSGNYSERQLEQAYRISGYLFASLRLVELLIRTVPIAAERMVGADWERLSETHHLNRVFQRGGGKLLSQMFLFEAVYGNTMVYKHKTRKAIIAERLGKPLPYYHQGGIAGFHVVPNINWELEEDLYNGEVTGFMLSQVDPEIGQRTRLRRDETVYHHEFDLREPNRGMSLVSRAIHDAVTDAAVSRWVAHYFLSGALPLLLISPENEDPMLADQSQLERYKHSIEQAWMGIYGEYALRAKFTDRRLHVEQVGIEAEKVTAPELDRKALNKIAAIVGITADLVVPPEGGSDNARHKYLIKQAWEQAVLPPVQGFLDAFNEDTGLEQVGLRLVIDRRNIPALQADRGETSQTEISIWQGGIQTFGETRQRLDQDENNIVAKLDNFLLIEGKPQSVERILRNDRMPNDALLTSIQGFWDGGVLKRSEVRQLAFNLSLPSGDKDGYKYEVVPDPSAGGFGGPGGTPSASGQPEPSPEPPPAPPALPQGENESESQASTPSTPEPAPAPETSAEDTSPPAKPEEDTDKAGDSPPAPDTLLVETGVEETPSNPLVPDEIVVTEETTGVVLDLPEAQLPAEEDLRLAQEAYASLWLGNNVQLERVGESIQAQYKQLPAQWSDPATYHITLVYCEDVPEETLKRIMALMPLAADALPLRLGPLTTFPSHDGRTVIALAVDLDSRLLDLQQRVYGAFSVYGLALSEFSAPERWMPHVTLGYAPPNTQVDGFMLTIPASPPCIRFERDGYQTIHEVPLTKDWRDVVQSAVPAWGIDNDALAGAPEEAVVSPQTVDDLWEMTLMFREKWGMALKRWQETGDVPRVLPAQIREAVRACLGQGASQQVFAAAMQAVEAGLFDEHVVNDDNPVLKMLAQPEEDAAMQETALSELVAWQKKAMRSVKAATGFEVKRLPVHLEVEVRQGLEEAGADKEKVKAVFKAVRAAYYKEYVPSPTDEEMLVRVAERMQEIGDAELVKALDVPDEDEPDGEGG